jgi:hypothetical protein
MQANNKVLKYYLLLLIVLLIAYLPLSSLHFAMKNDAFSDNFPNKYFLSQSLHAGIIPLWNPYMNFGFPIYADPGFAYWNPVTWLFAAIGYSAYTLTIEVLLYIYLGGAFMFRLCKWLNLSLPVAFIVACMYMCSGFYTGSIQYINFITAAAFLPLLIQAFLKLIYTPCFYNAIIFSLSLVFVAMGGHPAIPFAAIYLLLILFIAILIFQQNRITNLRKFIIFLLVSVILFLIFFSPALYSYASIWNVYGRNTPQQHFEITNTGFSIASLISLLFPFSINAHTSFLNNDVAMRNAYFSLPGFSAIFFAIKTKNKFVYCLLFTAFIFLILSIGGGFKEIIYQYLPLLKYIRTNGEYRIFFILLLCVVSGFGLEQIISNRNSFIKLKLFFKYFIAADLFVLILTAIFFRNKITGFFAVTFSQHFSANLAKEFFQNMNFPVALIISLVIAIIVALLIIRKKHLSAKYLAAIICFDIIINACICLPVTGVGSATVRQVQSFYNNNPPDIPVPPLISVKDIDTLNDKLTGLIGNVTYYNKKIGTTKLTDYPSYFKSTDTFFKSPEKEFVLNRPYLFVLNDNNNNSIKVLHFEPQKIVLTVQSTTNDSLICLQNNYKFWRAFENKKPLPVTTAFSTFISIPLSPGNHTIEFIYKDSLLLFFSIISVIVLVAMLIIIAKEKFFHKTQHYASTTSVLLK